MTIGSIDAAIHEATRFLAVAKAARERIVREYAVSEGWQDGGLVLKPRKVTPDSSLSGGSHETAACKRASLDLTRALADLRRRA